MNDFNTDGFIANDIISVLPYAVYKPDNPDKMMSVDYSKLTPVLTAGKQELKSDNKMLRELISKLSDRLEKLAKR